jgi:aquaporin Z
MEAAELGAFMIAACVFAVVLDHPSLPLRGLLPDSLRRVLTGIAMGVTAIAIVYSPWGKRSGAHFNPAVTLTFWRLGKIESWDAFFYVVSQFFGGVLGVVVASLFLGPFVSDPSVNYVATVPGPAGVPLAFLAEVLMAFLMMSMILRATNASHLARFTGIFAGALVAAFISLEAPISGMSINPARTFGSAVSARLYPALWLYFLAPSLGMVLAAEVHRWRGAARVMCAKLHHQNSERCIFRCAYPK